MSAMHNLTIGGGGPVHESGGPVEAMVPLKMSGGGSVS
jgi:hypothetical protein